MPSPEFYKFREETRFGRMMFKKKKRLNDLFETILEDSVINVNDSIQKKEDIEKLRLQCRIKIEQKRKLTLV